MKKIKIICLLTLAGSCAFAATYRDAMGRVVGTKK